MRRSIRVLPAACALATILAAGAAVRAEEPAPPASPPTANPETSAAPAPASQAAATARLQGSAILARNRPVAGATVVVRSESAAGAIWITSTDQKGGFRLDALPADTYAVEFSREGLTAVRKEKIEVRPPFRAIVEVTMSPGPPGLADPASFVPEAGSPARLDLEGAALGPDGHPVSDVRVRLMRSDGSEDPHIVLTGEDGTFRMSDLGAGVWEVESVGLAYLPQRARLTLTAPTRMRLRLVSQPATYEPLPLDLLPREEPIPPPQG